MKILGTMLAITTLGLAPTVAMWRLSRGIDGPKTQGRASNANDAEFQAGSGDGRGVGEGRVRHVGARLDRKDYGYPNEPDGRHPYAVVFVAETEADAVDLIHGKRVAS